MTIMVLESRHQTRAPWNNIATTVRHQSNKIKTTVYLALVVFSRAFHHHFAHRLRPDNIPSTVVLFQCYYTVVTVVTLLVHCCCTVVTLLLHCWYTVVTLLLHCCYTVVTLLLQLLSHRLRPDNITSTTVLPWCDHVLILCDDVVFI
jgi:hypothetical protein